jgi:DNA repair exonuclease SbcCD ATPase subunit
MNSVPLSYYESDSRQKAIDLDGLESFLTQTEEQVPPTVEETETQIILRLLDQLHQVGSLVKETTEKLAGANERLNGLSTLVAAQNKQMEILSVYQAQAARVSGLEQSLATAIAENQRLKQSFWRKIFFWIK